MNSKLLKYLAMPSMLLLSACSTTKYNESTNIQLDSFHEQLAHNYKNSGDSLGNTFDVRSKSSFKRKSSMLMYGKDVQPTVVSSKCNDVELKEARVLLEKALSEKKCLLKDLLTCNSTMIAGLVDHHALLECALERKKI